MVALNFKSQFADDVEMGRKRRSIRARRKDGLDPIKGVVLQLYTGMRRVGCRKLGEAICTRVRPVLIDACSAKIDGRILYAGHAPHNWGCACPEEEFDGDFAQADGFDSYSEMVDFFRAQHGLPFNGLLIQWGDFRAPSSAEQTGK